MSLHPPGGGAPAVSGGRRSAKHAGAHRLVQNVEGPLLQSAWLLLLNVLLMEDIHCECRTFQVIVDNVITVVVIMWVRHDLMYSRAGHVRPFFR